MALRLGLLALARATFDVPYAEEMAAKAIASLRAAGHTLVGATHLLFDAEQTRAALAALDGQPIDMLLVLQVTFTDAVMTKEIAAHVGKPLTIWAFPEPRAGGRLRLNSFCGMNLAAHALGRARHPMHWIHAAPDDSAALARLDDIAAGRVAPTPPARPTNTDVAPAQEGQEMLGALRGATIGLIGEHPAGFDTCSYDAASLSALAGVEVETMPLSMLFAHAETQRNIPGVVDHWREEASALGGLDTLVPAELEKSLSIGAALDEIADDRGLAAFAVRCWPETFTEYGCAACGPMGMMTEMGIPCACEADLYGALTSLMLNTASGDVSWLVDIVDMDGESDTAVFWHCGSAPLSMADPHVEPVAQIHSNRKMALLQEFPLKPGRITVCRITQAHNNVRMVLAGAEAIRAPKSFTGTSGVVRFDRNAGEVAAAMMDIGLEHHVAMVYGEHRPALRALAKALKIDVVDLA